MSWEKKTRRRVVSALKNDADQALAEKIRTCSRGTCSKCGDLCPAKADAWRRAYFAKIVRLLQDSNGPCFLVRFTRERWARNRGQLQDGVAVEPSAPTNRSGRQRRPVSQAAIEKTIRRSLDKLQMPAVTAIGFIDAWYGYKRWELGATLVVAGATKTRLYDVFPACDMMIEEIADVAKTVKSVTRNAYIAKWLRPADAAVSLSSSRQREYYLWLASIKSNDHLFRFGCDRYFNALTKQPKIIKAKVSKPRPYPKHLIPFMFNNHPSKCHCRACGGLGKYYVEGRNRDQRIQVRNSDIADDYFDDI